MLPVVFVARPRHDWRSLLEVVETLSVTPTCLVYLHILLSLVGVLQGLPPEDCYFGSMWTASAL